MKPEPHGRAAHAWLALFRLPNLLTVPGDPLAGWLLATAPGGGDLPALAAVLGAALCFYAAGLAWNDYVDRHEDAVDRPDRPLPSGRITPRAAWRAGGLLAAAGLLLCAWAGWTALGVGLALTALIAAYNFGLKRIPLLGSCALGACRALNLLLGAAAVAPDALWHGAVPLAAVITGAYIIAVSQLARRETELHDPGPAAWTPAAVLGLGLLAFRTYLPVAPLERLAALLVYAGALLVAVRFGTTQRRPTRALPVWIGRLIGLLPGLQAAWVLSAGHGTTGALIAGLLIAAWGVHRRLARRFHAS